MAAVGTSPDERDVPTHPTRGDRLGERTGAADFHNMIDAACR
jgi:hypothetical protein